MTDDCLPLLFGDRLGLSGLQKELIYLYDLEDLTVLEVVAQAINRVKNSGRGFTAQYLAARAIIDEAIADQGSLVFPHLTITAVANLSLHCRHGTI